MHQSVLLVTFLSNKEKFINPRFGEENGFRARTGGCAELREELTVCVAHSALTLPHGMNSVRGREFVGKWSARGLLQSPAVTDPQLFARERLFALA